MIMPTIQFSQVGDEISEPVGFEVVIEIESNHPKKVGRGKTVTITYQGSKKTSPLSRRQLQERGVPLSMLRGSDLEATVQAIRKGYL
jgi:hypothetical protein